MPISDNIAQLFGSLAGKVLPSMQQNFGDQAQFNLFGQQGVQGAQEARRQTQQLAQNQ